MKQILQILVVIAMLVAVTGCDFGCDDEVVSSTSSPSRAISAVVFNRNCGATTGFNTQVSLLRAGTAPSGPGNTLILDGSVPLKFLWISESNLKITGLGSAKIFKQEQTVADVSVAYGK